MDSDLFDYFALGENREKLSSDTRLSSYLAAVARNKAFGLLRKTRNDLSLNDDMIIIDEHESNPQAEAEGRELGRLIKEALTSLDKIQSELFIRHYYYGDTIKQAAEALNINLSTAKTWLYKSKEFLREYLEKNWSDGTL
ncbi:MAG: sigma-70 family RNA polymerase sigma factor [Bacteroides sp.]|nr:sigma-70 family RNA polymerase sigma factor [Bacteroides sp.]